RTEMTYVLDATTVFANPERGFYHYEESRGSAPSALDVPTLRAYREGEAISHIYRVFYLDTFVSTSITGDYLAKIRADFDAVRTAGLSAIVRFAYTDLQS